MFPGLRIRPSLFRRERLREVTTFSVHMAMIDWANKMNYSMDAAVIGAFVNTSAVAVWAIGQRLAELTQRLANQLNDILFPAVVENDTAARLDRLQMIFVQGTRLSLAAVVPLAGGMLLLAGPLVRAWVGPDFAGSVIVLQILSIIVIVRVGNATASTLLKGAGEHRLIAVTNMGAAIVNVALSIALVRPFGLVGVAVGTLIPVCLVLMLVVFPAGCRRVEVTVPHALAHAVWRGAVAGGGHGAIRLRHEIDGSQRPGSGCRRVRRGSARLRDHVRDVRHQRDRRQFYLQDCQLHPRRGALTPVSESL